MESISSQAHEILPPNPIRVETALSRYPIHRLAKRGDIAINIREPNAQGEVSIKWEVSHIPKFGQPGPLAYKIDTLIINRKIEEAIRPLPRIIRLGSLKEIAGQLDLGGDTNIIKRALRQNATTFISAKISYKRPDGSSKYLEADFNRYHVVFTGEELPNGRKADSVYIVMNDMYMNVINGAMTRPLDYDYLKSLPPASQRFYELLSYQMYAAIRNDRPRAKLVYSEFCAYAPQTRHYDWNRARLQMNKIYRPHKESGYIAKLDYQDAVDGSGQPDWIMFYQPGPKARAEYRAFTKRGGPTILEVEPFPFDPIPQLAAPQPTPVEKSLIGLGVTPAIAAELSRSHSEAEIAVQIEHLDWMIEKKPGKITDSAAWLVSAIRTGHAKPKGFVSKAERQRQAEERQAKERQEAEQRRREREQEAREKAEKQAVIAYRKTLTPQQLAEHEAQALAQASEDTRAGYERIDAPEFRKMLLGSMTDEYIRQLLRDRPLMPAAG